MRFRAAFLASTIACGMGMPTHAEVQTGQVQSVADFLLDVGDPNRMYVNISGVLDGGIVAEARNHVPFRYCMRDASYLEISNAYLAFLTTEDIKRNTAIFLSRTLLFSSIRFMDHRYRC